MRLVSYPSKRVAVGVTPCLACRGGTHTIFWVNRSCHVLVSRPTKTVAVVAKPVAVGQIPSAGAADADRRAVGGILCPGRHPRLPTGALSRVVSPNGFFCVSCPSKSALSCACLVASRPTSALSSFGKASCSPKKCTLFVLKGRNVSLSRSRSVSLCLSFSPPFSPSLPPSRSPSLATTGMPQSWVRTNHHCITERALGSYGRSSAGT